jgi:hypothetical protein
MGESDLKRRPKAYRARPESYVGKPVYAVEFRIAKKYRHENRQPSHGTMRPRKQATSCPPQKQEMRCVAKSDQSPLSDGEKALVEATAGIVPSAVTEFASGQPLCAASDQRSRDNESMI